MKTNEKLGGIENTPNDQIFQPSAKRMDEKMFWEIVEKSLVGTATQKQQLKKLSAILKKLSADDILGFYTRHLQLQRQLYTSKMWCACGLMNKGYASDDSFDYFRAWVISRGKDVYEAARKNPDSLAKEFTNNKKFYDFEIFSYVSCYVFERVFKKEIYDFIPQSLFPSTPRLVLNWSYNNPETMRKICPNLFDKSFMKNTLTRSHKLRVAETNSKKKGHNK